MAVELMSYTDAANAGIQSIEILLKMLSHQSSVSDKNIDYSAIADATIDQFKKFISVLDQNRTGHARFRRGPVTPIVHHQSTEPEPVVQTTASSSNSLVTVPVPIGLVDKKEEAIRFAAVSEGTNSSISSLIGDSESVQLSGFQITNKSQVSWSMGRPPLPAAMKRKSMSVDDMAVAKCGSSSGKCHCLKKRKSTVNRVVRVPAISSKVADIPSDDFSWRKYGQKPIKGSPHPRGYYRCSSVKGCPAQKHVERTLDDQNMLIVTYKGEHCHS